MNSVKDRKGSYAARRVERAADEVPNLEQQYTAKLLPSLTTKGHNAT
jgi:hypothetical protein